MGREGLRVQASSVPTAGRACNDMPSGPKQNEAPAWRVRHIHTA
jgi:hypothetical protein